MNICKFKHGDRVEVRLTLPANHQVTEHLGTVLWRLPFEPGLYAVKLDVCGYQRVISDSMMHVVQP